MGPDEEYKRAASKFYMDRRFLKVLKNIYRFIKKKSSDGDHEYVHEGPVYDRATGGIDGDNQKLKLVPNIPRNAIVIFEGDYLVSIFKVVYLDDLTLV